MKSGSLNSTAQAIQFLNQVSERRCSVSDAKVKGLQLERLRMGVGKWRLRSEDEGGRGRSCITLGDAPLLSLAEARALAEKAKKQIAMGEHPAAKKALNRQVPTVYDFIQNSYLPFVEGYKRSWKCDEGLLRKHIEPIWGKRYLDHITKADVIALMAKHRTTHAPGSCNRLLILLRYVFSCSLKWEIPGIKANPTAGIPLMKEDNVKERYLSTFEAQRLYEVLTRSDNVMLQYIIPMLILTGARKREVLDARWEDFDYERRQWRIHTTKLGKPRFVPMSDGVINLLESVPRHECEWAFPNPKTLKPYVSIYYSWDSAREEAGLEDVRIHDLRHSYASFLVNAGRSLYEVQRLLGHTQIKTTQRYAHLSHDTLLDATNSVNTALCGVFMPIAPPMVHMPLAMGA
jgi:integrase